MENEKHLKPEIYYSDMYDRYTVEQLRRSEKFFKNTKIPPLKGEEKEEFLRAKAWMENISLYFERGGRYANKKKTVQEWMDKDRERDELYETAEAPKGIRCLTCRNLMKPTTKDLWTGLDKPDRVLFMYECPNKCLPHRAFFNDGEEFRTKPNLCPHCSTKLNEKSKDTGEKLITESLCPNCKYTNTEELKWTHKEEVQIDEKFAEDRDRFCMTEEEGKEFGQAKTQVEQMGKLVDEWKEEEKNRAERLEANPKGFHLEGAGYTCSICGEHTPEGDNWYDEWGIKCLVCQKAIDVGEIPPNLAKEKDSWYSMFDIEYNFELKSPTLRKWIRQGILKAHTISHYGNGIHAQIFLIEDNKDFLPPKKLIESHSVSEVKDGKTWHHSEKWYRFVDAKKHLKGYKIMDYLQVVKEEKPNNERKQPEKNGQEKTGLDSGSGSSKIKK